MPRVDHALSSLVSALIPAIAGEDDASADERHEEALELAKTILSSHSTSAERYDVNHVSDLIKTKLWRDNDAPDQALRYSNLYAKLLTLPVVTRKWAVLYLLHQLSELESGEVDSARSMPRPSEVTQNRPSSRHEVDGVEVGPQRQQARPFNDVASSSRLNVQPKKDGVIPNYNSKGPSVLSGKTREELSEPVAIGEVAKRPTEAMLLRDLPFTLQGLSSINLPFGLGKELYLPTNLPLPLISLLYTLAEPSLLYRSLSEFVQLDNDGLIGQSLRSAIGSELRSYLGLIATLEGEIRKAIGSMTDPQLQNGMRKAGVTLKRCVVWTREATMGLRLMSVMAEDSRGRKGGQLISMVHSFSTSYGDPFISSFAERILSHLTKPFYDMLRHWIYDGELSDPYHEFFVIEQEEQITGEREIDPRRPPATSVWEDKYKLDDSTVPSIITEELAKKVFLIGKSLNFIRYGCGDSAWVEAYSQDASKELKYGDTATLETSIDEAYKTTMARLINLMDNKFKLFDHLNALKKYLLLGQGDFIALLMESLSSNLDRPAGSQYRHTLTAQLEHAIRGSNAQYDSPDVLRRLDARLLELSHGEIGWDVFTLEYKVDAPVDVVITAWANKQYLVVFNFLWRIKRVEFALGSTWRRCMTGARGVLAVIDERVGKDWKVARACIAEMIHFVNQLQYYILFEVIEASWDQLQAAIAKPDCTLDDLISAHTKYLQAITHKGLLGSARSSITGSREDSFTSQLHYILKIMLAYKEVVDGLYSYSVTEFTRSQEVAAKRETSRGGSHTHPHNKHHLNNLSSASSDHLGSRDSLVLPPFPAGLLSAPGDGDDMLPSLRKRLSELSADFRSRLNTLLGDLMLQPDVDMKFLGVVMNFNDVYTPRRRRREREKRIPGEKEGGKEKDGVGNGGIVGN